MERSDTAVKDGFLSRCFAEKRIFVKSDTGTRLVRVGTGPQIAGLLGGSALLAWAVFATAFVVIDMAGSGRASHAADRKEVLYEERLTDLARQRDDHEAAAAEAQMQFAAALNDLSRLQDELFRAKLEIKEKDSSRDVLRTLLKHATAERTVLTERLAAIESDDAAQDANALSHDLDVALASLDFMTGALSRTARDRDGLMAEQQTTDQRIRDLEDTLLLNQQANERIFTQLEDAVTLSMDPLGKLLESAGLSPDQVIGQMRRRYSGQGGPLMPISLSTKGSPELDADSQRANVILANLDELNLYRMALEKLPFATPVPSATRMTSLFGYRRDPINGGRRLHSGLDWAGSYGTTIKATADGVVTRAGWMSGYGRIVEVQHEFGITTRYAHLSKINVKKGQRVSRGDKIGAMGNSGRSTGTHLHYEVRVDGTPVNPLTYIKAARDVL
ncbi:MAG: DUF5930 domain-containing protein [Qingshengfaniella sp.]